MTTPLSMSEPGRSGVCVAVVTVSDRAAAGERRDESGPHAARRLREAGFDVGDPVVVADGEHSVRHALELLVSSGARFIITLTGGSLTGPGSVPM